MDEKIKANILKITLFITIISSILITIVSRIDSLGDYGRQAVLPISIIIIAYTVFIKLLKIKVNESAYFYLIYIFLILFSHYIIPLDDINYALNIIVVYVLTSIYIFSLVNNNYKIGINFYKWLFKLIPGYLFSNLEYAKDAVNEVKINNKHNKDIIKGLLIGGGLLIVLLTLLSSADKYFASFISKVLSFIHLDFTSLIQIGITLTLSFIFIFSTTINIYQNLKRKEFDINKKDVNNTISYIILGFVNFAYLLFLISEISKITTNFLSIPINYTYAQYAREGFFQLLVVTSINFGILIYYQNFLKNNNKWIKYLLLTIIFFSIFLIFNSYYRMGLYIFEYGFTILRLQVILFLTMELLFFIILTIRLFKPAKKSNNFRYLIIIMITYFLNVYLCNDLIINFINELLTKNNLIG